MTDRITTRIGSPILSGDGKSILAYWKVEMQMFRGEAFYFHVLERTPYYNKAEHLTLAESPRHIWVKPILQRDAFQVWEASEWAKDTDFDRSPWFRPEPNSDIARLADAITTVLDDRYAGNLLNAYGIDRILKSYAAHLNEKSRA